MKIKHQGLLSVCLICIAIVVSGAYTLGAAWKTPGGGRIDHLKPLPHVTVPGPAAMKEIEQLGARLYGLVSPPQPDPSGVNLLLFGYEPVREAGGAARGRLNGPPGRAGYALTFTFFSERKQFCIIDGAFYSQGAALPGGDRILKIRPGRVLVKGPAGSSWIPLESEAGLKTSGGTPK
ncbi:MAG: hypothetical protein GY697_05515 [Desulfobacterales bacterium]|nr:hypothetical protein [Desulfobacterales bacterium]